MSVKPSPASSRTPISRLRMSIFSGSGSARPLDDLAVDDLVEHAARAHHLRPGRAWAAQQAQVEVGSVEAERPLEVLGGGGSLAGLVGIEAEQRPHRDPHRQAAHPLVDVDHLPGRKRSIAGVASATIASHRGGDLLAVEGGHHDLAGAVVVGVVDRQQAVAKQRDQVAEARLAPVEVLRMGDGDEVVRLRAEHEDDRAVQQADAEDRPVLLVEGEQHRQRVARRLQGAAEVEALRPRRIGAAAADFELGANVFERRATPGWRSAAAVARPAGWLGRPSVLARPILVG